MPLVALLVGALAWIATGLSEEEKGSPGKDLFVTNKCNSCHMVSKEGIEGPAVASAPEAADSVEAAATEASTEAAPTKQRAPDLSGVGLAHEAAWMAKYLQRLEEKEGKKHLKKFRGTGDELGVLTEWLASLKHEMKGIDRADSASKSAAAGEDSGAATAKEPTPEADTSVKK
jgi:hypothetical protein